MQGLDRSYASASDNAGLIIRIPEYVSPKQWEYILEAFCKNVQIYDASQCPATFYTL